MLVWNSIVVEVEDDGPGVAPALAGQIFEPFFSTKGIGAGTGLGLSIALGIVQAHEGSLDLIESKTGARFRMTLPAATAREGADKSSLPANVRAWEPRTSRRALVVDDEPAQRQLLRRLLTKRKFTVDEAENGEAALALIDANKYDVLFCDVQMPKMGGLALFDRLQEPHTRLVTPPSRFVFVTGDILNMELQSLIDQSRSIILTKPFEAAQLDTMLEQLFSVDAA
jgi:CheY-like chemotaxis protein